MEVDSATELINAPDRDYDWHLDPRTVGGVAKIVHPDTNRLQLPAKVSNRSTYSVKSTEVGFITDGADEYRDRYGQAELPIPTSYTQFADNAVTYYGYSSITCSRWGIGITPARLEQAIRIATGGGRYCRNDITVTGCGECPFLVETADHAFLMTPTDIDEPPESVLSNATVRGITIENEMNGQILEGVEGLIDAVDEFADIEIIGFAGRRQSSLKFRFDSGEELSISAADLRTLSLTHRDIVGTHSFEDDWRVPDEVEVTEDDLDYQPGEDAEFLGRCIGHVFSVKDHPRRSGGRKRLHLKHVMLSITDRINIGTYQTKRVT